jgi:MYXO-CTERM domain-containing protein
VAQAHVSIQPSEAPAGDFTRLDVRVPNEQDNASTTKVSVQFPPGFTEASYQPVPGWKTKVTKSKLEKPVKSDEGETITEQVSEMTWTGSGSGTGRIGPGQFQDFGLSVQIPEKPNTSLTFKATQTYSNGDVVRWIGPPDAEEPAPQVKITAAGAAEGAATTNTAATGSKDEDSDDNKTLSVIALIVGGLGLLAGGAALLTRRRAA